MVQPLVTIITATFDSEEYILDTYKSIQSQTYSNWEWVVTDDCSSDNTLLLLEHIESNDSRVTVLQNKENSGAAVSRNRSIKIARGEFIAFIDSDDIWDPNKLEEQLEFMGEDIDFSFTAYELIDGSGNNLNKSVDSTQVGSFSYNDMLRKKATLGCSTVMLRRSAFDDLTMPLIRTGQDYATWLKLLKTGKRAHVINKILTKYRILPGSISRNKVKKAQRQWQIYREIEKLGVFESIVNFGFYACRAVLRKA
ncbi:glycosyltransferase family 2 protein [Vibrio metschnikovii]|uniref:glycosyltransferase family 2 protein n=1 Tax=Vibrio metschnikovii TaxID=28172 RepID=UPI002FCBDBFF